MGRSRRRGFGPFRPFLLVLVVATLLTGWILAAVHLLLLTDGGAVPVPVSVHVAAGTGGGGGTLRRPTPASPGGRPTGGRERGADGPALRIVSRDAGVTIRSDVRGNLGPASVLLQDPPGADWIKDRWPAASDMGGTAIRGSHWILVDFSGAVPGGGGVEASRLVLDWETSYASDYTVGVRADAPPGGGGGGEDDAGWCRLFDGGDGADLPRRTSAESGRSPGVKARMPLHVVHTIDLAGADPSRRGGCGRFRYLRLFIRRGARPWGVSLWQLDVYGRVLGRDDV